VPEVTKTDDNTYIIKKYYTIVGRRVAMHDGAQLLSLTGDHLSSTSLVMDAAGAVLSEQRYTGHRASASAAIGLERTDRESPFLISYKLQYWCSFGANVHNNYGVYGRDGRFKPWHMFLGRHDGRNRRCITGWYCFANTFN